MSRCFGLIFVCALSAGCGGDALDAVSAAELNGTWTGANTPAAVAEPQSNPTSQCRLDVTTQVNATKVVGTYSTFACEGTPSDLTARR